MEEHFSTSHKGRECFKYLIDQLCQVHLKDLVKLFEKCLMGSLRETCLLEAEAKLEGVKSVFLFDGFSSVRRNDRD